MKYKLLILLAISSTSSFAQGDLTQLFAQNSITLDECFKNGDKLRKSDHHVECLTVSKEPKKAVEYLYAAETGVLAGKKYYGFSIPATRIVKPGEPDFNFAVQREVYTAEMKKIPTLEQVITDYFTQNPDLTKDAPPNEIVKKNWAEFLKQNPDGGIKTWTQWTLYNFVNFVLAVTHQNESIKEFAVEDGASVGLWKPEEGYLNKVESFIASIRKSQGKKYFALTQEEKTIVAGRIDQVKERLNQCNPDFYNKLKENTSLIKTPVSLDDDVPVSYFMFDIFGISEPNMILSKNALRFELEEEEKTLDPTIQRLNIPRFVREMAKSWSVVGMINHPAYLDLRKHIQPNLIKLLTQDVYPSKNPEDQEIFSTLMSKELKEKIRMEIMEAYQTALSKSANTFLADNIPCVL